MGARWAQAFSTSDATLTLGREEIVIIDDIEHNDRVLGKQNFTDGVGTISPTLARKVYRELQRARRSARSDEIPSAFQIRLGGAKGEIYLLICMRLCS